MPKPTLRNTYFLMRHGLAESNVQHRYSTNPDLGGKLHSLVPEGRQMVLDSITAAAPRFHLDSKTIILASPFLRTTQTAQIVADFLKCPPITFDTRLRERFCGEFDDTTTSITPAVHRQADTAIDSNFRGVENLQHLWARMYAVILDAEKKYHDQTILIISHGDPLECLYCGLQGGDLLGFHKAFPNFQKAEIRPAQAV